jgi:hypothetical protein
MLIIQQFKLNYDSIISKKYSVRIYFVTIFNFLPGFGSVVAPGPAFPTHDETVIMCCDNVTKATDPPTLEIALYKQMFDSFVSVSFILPCMELAQKLTSSGSIIYDQK